MTSLRLFFTATLILGLFVLAASPSHAQRIRDSIDYTLDDGIMSPEEMEMEARDMHMLCAANPYQRNYFDCECQAGAFLQQREKLGPMVMQHEIQKIITNSAQVDSRCVRTEELAARTYQSCLAFANGFSRTELQDNNEYCVCAANKMAQDFTKTPRLSTNYIERLRYNAMSDCRRPEVQQQYRSRVLEEQNTPPEGAPAIETPAP